MHFVVKTTELLFRLLYSFIVKIFYKYAERARVEETGKKPKNGIEMKKKLRFYRITYKKAWVLLWLLFFLVLAGIGLTYAYTPHAVQQSNRLKAHTVSVDTDEKTPSSGLAVRPGETVQKEVRFQNTGNAAVFLRFSYAETWTDPNASQSPGGEDIPGWLEQKSGLSELNWTSVRLTQWEEKNDGWYYYKFILPPGAYTDLVLTGVSFSPDLPEEYMEGMYELIFTVEAVQCSDEGAVNQAALTLIFDRATAADLTIIDGSVTGGTVEWN